MNSSLMAFEAVLCRRNADRGVSVAVNNIIRCSFDNVFSRDCRECIALLSVLSLKKPKTSCAHVCGLTHAHNTRAFVLHVRSAGVIPMRRVIRVAFEFHAVRTKTRRSPRFGPCGVLFKENPLTSRVALDSSFLSNFPGQSDDLT